MSIARQPKSAATKAIMQKYSTTTPIIAHIIYSGLGGHSAVLFALLEGGFMKTAQHIVLFAGAEEPPASYIGRCESLGLRWVYVSKRPGGKHLEFIFAVRNELSKIGADILFQHGLSVTPSIALLKIFRTGKKPFVLVRETQANSLKTARDWVLLAIAHRSADRIIHLTAEAATSGLKRLGKIANVGKVSVIGNGLNTDFFCPSDRSRPPGQVIHIGMQSRLTPNKDHTTLINAFASLRGMLPDNQIHLHIAGDGASYQSIAAMIRQYNLSEVATLHGLLDQTELREFLQGLDIYVHCTHGETMSTAIMQALSCGLPVIASDVSGVDNMISSNHGILYEPGNASDLASKLRYLIANPDAARALAESARKCALRSFSISSTIKAYEQIIPQCFLQVNTVIHLIPYDGVGGVESAVRSVQAGEYWDFRFVKHYLVDKVSAIGPSGTESLISGFSENDPRAYILALYRIWKRKPQLVVASLWRSYVVLIVLKIIRPRGRFVTFLHHPRDFHFVDWALSRLSMFMSDEIWVDSRATLDGRVPAVLASRARVISFVTRRLKSTIVRECAPRFIFWGRIHPQKGLAHCLQILSLLRLRYPEAMFHIVGPDGGDRETLNREVARLDLESSVHFHGPMVQDDIFKIAEKCSFYFQCSLGEGMAMSVVEAMQIGLVPVVIPVGEIANYCVHGVNSLLIQSDEKAVKDISDVLADTERYGSLSRCAARTWDDHPLYADAFLHACRGVL